MTNDADNASSGVSGADRAQGAGGPRTGQVERVRVLHERARSLHARLGEILGPGELDEYGTALDDLLGVLPHDDPSRAMYGQMRVEFAGRASEMSVAAWQRHLETGSPEDLELAVALGRRAVAAAGEDDPNRTRVLADLGRVLQNEIARTRDRAVTEEAIGALEEAVAATGADSPHRVVRVSMLGMCLWHRATQRMAAGEDPTADLDRAIVLHRDAVARAEAGGFPDPGGPLGNLAVVLDAAGRARGDDGLTAEAGRRFESAVEATPPGHPERFRRLANLGGHLWTCFRESGDRESLLRAVDVLKQAERELPEGSGLPSVLASALEAAELEARKR